jgi:transcriptional antiterminator NusG
MENKMNWYIVRTMSGKENTVKDRLDREIIDGVLKDKVKDVIVPMETIFTIKSGKKNKRDRVMFSGYVFVSCNDLETLKSELNSISGASGFLKSRSGEVQKLSQIEVNRMIGIEEKSKLDDVDNPFIVGEDVIITNGPFNSMKAIIDKIDNNKVKLSVLIFGRKTPLELDIGHISKN